MIESLTIILPLYNEEKRLKESFKKISKFLANNRIKIKELIFVDDGSTDNSSEMIKKYIKRNNLRNKNLKLINYKKNKGKGNAIKVGVKNSTGKWVLTSDIDFSVSLFEIINWQKKGYIENKYKVYFGSRSHKKSIVKSKLHRKVIGNLLRLIISFMLNIKLKDTQCGYKLYSRNIAKYVFSKMQSLKFEHDIEIVLILKKKKINIKELPVTWFHVPQSKVNLISDSIKVFKSIFILKKKYLN